MEITLDLMTWLDFQQKSLVASWPISFRIVASKIISVESMESWLPVKRWNYCTVTYVNVNAFNAKNVVFHIESMFIYLAIPHPLPRFRNSRRQRGRVVRTPDLKSGGHGFKSRSDHLAEVVSWWTLVQLLGHACI